MPEVNYVIYDESKQKLLDSAETLACATAMVVERYLRDIAARGQYAFDFYYGCGELSAWKAFDYWRSMQRQVTEALRNEGIFAAYEALGPWLDESDCGYMVLKLPHHRGLELRQHLEQLQRERVGLQATREEAN